MKIEELKNKVLDLAVRGKLVAQNPSEESAIMLLERIKKERMIEKEKPLQEIKEDEIPFDIPGNWEWTRLGEIVSVKSSKRIYSREYQPSGIPFFRSKEIGELGLGKEITSELYISTERYDEIKEKFGVPNIGDILLTSVGTIGNTWIVDDRKFYYKDGNITQLETHELIYNYYLEYFIKSNHFIDATNKTISGTAYNALTIEKINKVIFPLPPLEEQRRIVEKVDELFEIIDRLNKDKEIILQGVKEVRDKTIELALKGKLVEQDASDDTAKVLLREISCERERLVKKSEIKRLKLEAIKDIPFEIPKAWAWTRLGEIISFKIGKTPKRSDLSYWKEGEYPWFSIADMKDGKTIFDSREKVSEKANEEVFKGQISPKGTLVMSFKLTIGKMSILGVDGYHNEAIISMYPILDSDDAIKMYLFKIMRGLNLLEGSKGAIKGSTLNTTSLNNILIPLPPLNEQRRIVEKIDFVFNILDRLENNANAKFDTIEELIS